MSLPLNRTRLIRHARPREASQAPKVRRTSIVEMSEVLFFDIIIAIAVTMERIMASRARRAIRRCFRCRDIVSRAESPEIGRRKVIVVSITRRWVSNLRLTRSALYGLSYSSVKRQRALIFNSQS